MFFWETEGILHAWKKDYCRHVSSRSAFSASLTSTSQVHQGFKVLPATVVLPPPSLVLPRPSAVDVSELPDGTDWACPLAPTLWYGIVFFVSCTTASGPSHHCRPFWLKQPMPRVMRFPLLFFAGGYWYNDCYISNLNGPLCSEDENHSKCMVWWGNGGRIILKEFTLMIREMY